MSIRHAQGVFVYVRQGISNATLECTYCLCLSLVQLNKDTNDLLWLAIVGLTDQYIHQVCGHLLETHCLGMLSKC